MDTNSPCPDSPLDRACLAQTWNQRVDIHLPGDAACNTYRHPPEQPKPCVHPLVTPRGHCLTGFEMSDHIWHRGVWFTIKYINGTNYWEENTPFGIQVATSNPTCEMLEPGKLRLHHQQRWTSDATGDVFTEKRTLTWHIAPDSSRILDWTTTLTAKQNLTLDRTPFKTWGGYGGLAYRGARELHDVSFILPDGETAEALTGQSHPWVAMQALVDGGPDQHVSVCMIDHPSNPRSPSPWYCKCRDGFTYMNPAFLFHEPMDVKNGQSLTFSYRILYRDGSREHDALVAAAAKFQQSEIHI